MATSSLVSLTIGLLAEWSSQIVARFPSGEAVTTSIANSIDDLDDLINFVMRAQADAYAAAVASAVAAGTTPPPAVKPDVIPFFALCRTDIDRMPGGGRSNRGIDVILYEDASGATSAPAVPVAVAYDGIFVCRTFAEAENWLEFLFIYFMNGINYDYPLDLGLPNGNTAELGATFYVDSSNSKATPYSDDKRQLYYIKFGVTVQGFLISGVPVTTKRFNTVNLTVRTLNTGGTVTEYDEDAVIHSDTPPNPLP